MINNVVLVGRLTKDIELKDLENKSVANFSLAVQRKLKNENGEREADFINCVIWNETAKLLKEYSKKGDLIGVEGRLQTSNYEKEDGTKVYKTEVIVERITFLNSKKEDNKDGE